MTTLDVDNRDDSVVPVYNDDLVIHDEVEITAIGRVVLHQDRINLHDTYRCRNDRANADVEVYIIGTRTLGQDRLANSGALFYGEVYIATLPLAFSSRRLVGLAFAGLAFAGLPFLGLALFTLASRSLPALFLLALFPLALLTVFSLPLSALIFLIFLIFLSLLTLFSLALSTRLAALTCRSLLALLALFFLSLFALALLATARFLIALRLALLTLLSLRATFRPSARTFLHALREDEHGAGE